MLEKLSDKKIEFMSDMVNAILPLTDLQEEIALTSLTLAKRIAALPPSKLELLEAFITEQETLLRGDTA